MTDKPAPDPMALFDAQLAFLKTKPKPDYKAHWYRKTKLKPKPDSAG